MRRVRAWFKRHNPLRLWHAHRFEAGDRWRILGHAHTVLLSHPTDLVDAHPELLPSDE